MAGSGTVLALAQSLGLRASGFDVDPLAVLISSVWTTPVEREEVVEHAHAVLERAQVRADDGLEFPVAASDATVSFIRYWFDRSARMQLVALAASISRVKSESVRNVLWCGLSRLIITKQGGASRAMDLAHSRPHRAYRRGPRRPFDHFLYSVARVVSGTPPASMVPASRRARVAVGDARALPVPRESVDVVFSSPPYLNAIDYLRCSKFSLVWMGHQIEDLQLLRARSIGTAAAGQPPKEAMELARVASSRVNLADRSFRAIGRYADDTLGVMRELARVLAPGGRLVYVLGENSIRGVRVRTGRLAQAAAAQHGLKLVTRRSRLLPDQTRYLPPPTSGDGRLDARMRRELVLEFEPA